MQWNSKSELFDNLALDALFKENGSVPGHFVHFEI